MTTAKNIVNPAECTFTPVRSSGPGGQHANKVETGILLRFDIQASTLPEEVKNRLMKMRDSRISSSFVVTIQATNHRSQLKNRSEALARLQDMIDLASRKEKKRKKTRVPKSADQKRLEEKSRRSALKQERKKPSPDH